MTDGAIAFAGAIAITTNIPSALVNGGDQGCAEHIFTSGFDPPAQVTAFATTYDNFYRFDLSDPASFEIVSSSHFTSMKLDYVGNGFSRAYGNARVGCGYLPDFTPAHQV